MTNNESKIEQLISLFHSVAEKYGFNVDDPYGGLYTNIREILEEFIKENNSFAIYCAGEHTEHLMVDFVSQLRDVVCIIDNYKADSGFNGYNIIKDEQIDDYDLDGIIISSYDYAKQIEESLSIKHAEIRTLNIYSELDKRGLRLKQDFYNASHPYAHFRNINFYLRKAREHGEGLVVSDAYLDLISELFYLKDFKTAAFYAEELNEKSGDYEELCGDINSVYSMELELAHEISQDVVLVLTMDGMCRDWLLDESSFLPKMYDYLKKNSFIYYNAYSCSTYTYESLVPAFSENSDMRTNYFEKEYVPVNDCRMACEAVEQGRNIYVYGDGELYIDGKGIKHSGNAQSATEKMWDFIVDAYCDGNGFFYFHELYESHFSFPNPYTEDEMTVDGSYFMYDFLDSKGGRLRADYYQQFCDAMRYLDDVYTPFLERFRFRYMIIADHGNYVPGRTDKLSDYSKMKLDCGEEDIRIPMCIVSPEQGTGSSNQLISLMELNSIALSLLRKEKYGFVEKKYIKVSRSSIYNPNMLSLYSQIGQNDALKAYEAFIFKEGEKLVVYSDGKYELFNLIDQRIDDIDRAKEKYELIKDDVTVFTKREVYN